MYVTYDSGSSTELRKTFREVYVTSDSTFQTLKKFTFKCVFFQQNVPDILVKRTT
jgi:hypothetical protein